MQCGIPTNARPHLPIHPINAHETYFNESLITPMRPLTATITHISPSPLSFFRTRARRSLNTATRAIGLRRWLPHTTMKPLPDGFYISRPEAAQLPVSRIYVWCARPRSGDIGPLISQSRPRANYRASSSSP